MKVCPTCNRLYQSGIGVCPKDGGILHTLREWQAGDTVSEKFCIIEKIGHGSLGPAFRAKVLPFEGTRVLKCLSMRLAEDEDLISTFRREIQAASALRHPNAVHVESFERSPDGRPFMVMEFVPGLSLRELLSRGGYIPARDVVDIMGQVCAVLDSAHWQGIVHRNLKPDNVIISEEHGSAPHVKVMELGMANFRQAAAERGKQVGDVVTTDQAVVVGTMEYMSPEQATGSPTRMVDGRSDLYSVGVMMFEALTGELPIATEDPMGLLHQKLESAANEVLCGTVLRALQRDPDCRFQTATAMIAALREVSHSLAKPPSSKVGLASGVEAVQVSVSSQDIQQVIEGTPDPPRTNTARQNAERPVPRVAVRSHKSSADPIFDEAAASTDRTIEEIRKSWPQRAGEISARRVAQGKQVRTILLGVGFAIVVLLASWVTYRDRGLLETGRSEPVTLSNLDSPQAPPRDATSNREPDKIQAPLVEPSTDTQQPAMIKQGTSPPLPAASDDGNTPPAPRAAGRQSDRQKAPSATAVAAGERRPGALTDSSGIMGSDAREAEIKKRIAVGWLQVKRGDHRAAIESFTEALKLDPSNVEAQAALRLARFAIQNPNVDVFPSQPPAGGNDSKKGQP